MKKGRIDYPGMSGADWSRPDAAQKFIDRCNLFLKQRKYAETYETAFQCLKTKPERELRMHALSFMALAAHNYEAINPDKQKDFSHKLQAFLQTFDPITAEYDEKKMWVFILQPIFVNRFLDLQLQLTEEVFNQALVENLKSQVAHNYLMVARRIRYFEGREVETAKVRAMAEFILDKSQHFIKDHTKWDQAVFHTFIVNLVAFKLFDLVSRALEIRCPDPSDSVWRYLRWNEKYEKGEDEAFDQVLKMTALDAKQPGVSGIIIREIYNLRSKIIRRQMEAKKTDGERLPQMEKDSCLAQVMASPVSRYPSILQQIKQVREALFIGLRPAIKSRNHECWLGTFSAPPSFYDNIVIAKSYILLLPETSALEVYLADGTNEKALKFTYRMVDSKIAPSASEHQADTPLIYEYLAMLACQPLIDDAAKDRSFQFLHDKISAQILEEAKKIYNSKNRANWVQLEKQIHEHEEYRLKQIESDSRSYLARRTMEYGGLLERMRSAVLGLEATDPLFTHIKDIEVILPSDYDPIVGQGKETSSDGLRCYFGLLTQDDKRILVHVKSLDDISVPGASYLEDGLAIKLVRGLFYEAVVKLSVMAEKKDKASDHAGYVVDLEKDGHDPATDDFSKICRRVVLARFRKEGILSDNWYTRKVTEDDQELYYPLENQSLSAKEELIRQGRGGQLFVPLEPVGTIRRLPVRRVREGKEIKIAPWKRNPIRELQQRLFGDPRILPEYYGLYVISTFSNGKNHVYKYSLAKNEAEILEGKLIEKMEDEIRSGRFNRPEDNYRELFIGTEKKDREPLVQQLKAGELSIESQTAEIFYPIQSTYHRPPMASISALLEKGFKLK